MDYTGMTVGGLVCELRSAGFDLMKNETGEWAIRRVRAGPCGFPPELTAQLTARKPDVIRWLEGMAESGDQLCLKCRATITSYGMSEGVLCERSDCGYRVRGM